MLRSHCTAGLTRRPFAALAHGSSLLPAGDSFTPLLQHAFGHRWWTSRNVTITAVGCAAILPLTFRRSLGALAGVWALQWLCHNGWWWLPWGPRSPAARAHQLPCMARPLASSWVVVRPAARQSLHFNCLTRSCRLLTCCLPRPCSACSRQLGGCLMHLSGCGRHCLPLRSAGGSRGRPVCTCEGLQPLLGRCGGSAAHHLGLCMPHQCERCKGLHAPQWRCSVVGRLGLACSSLRPPRCNYAIVIQSTLLTSSAPFDSRFPHATAAAGH